METLGSLVDKLTIVNIRLWHLEDRRRDRTLVDAERLRAADMVSDANAQRNALIDELDQLLETAITNGHAPQARKLKLY